MIPYARALAVLLREASRSSLSDEPVPTSQALGRVAARNVLSPEALPAFDNSSMDGYAVSSARTALASPRTPVRLKVLGTLAAGAPAIPRRSFPVQAGAFEIMTGAPLPRGFDAVIRIEDLKVSDRGRTVSIETPAERGDYVRFRGQDFKRGMKLLGPGDVVEPRHILALSALGVRRLAARRRPRVALISTGQELLPDAGRPSRWRIRNATAAYIEASLPRWGAQLASRNTVGDDAKDFIALARQALKASPDVLLTTGAVSMGRHDFISGALTRLGARILFHKAAIHPGRPILAAKIAQGPLILSLPGNPLSTVVGLRFFLAPYLRRLMGMPREAPRLMGLARGLVKPQGLLCFHKAVANDAKKNALVRVLPGQASFQIRPLLEANAWAVLPAACGAVPAGNKIEVYPL